VHYQVNTEDGRAEWPGQPNTRKRASLFGGGKAWSPILDLDVPPIALPQYPMRRNCWNREQCSSEPSLPQLLASDDNVLR
jgi:hypothetical protein